MHVQKTGHASLVPLLGPSFPRLVERKLDPVTSGSLMFDSIVTWIW